jgi:hypothetical protein
LLLIVVGILATTSCGGAGAEVTTSTAAERQGTVDTEGRCPLTAEQVGEVLGTEVVADEGSCSFFPMGGALPNASHNPQSTVALLEETRAEYGYEESVADLGDEAYLARLADGTWLLVHAGELIFEIRVDTGSAPDELAAARQLAGIVLAAG